MLDALWAISCSLADQIIAIKISTDDRRLRATTTSPNNPSANTMTLPSA
jgi:hypothetical protein